MPKDVNELALAIVRQSTGQAPKPVPEPDTRNPAAVALSKMGASKGGKARASQMTKAERVKAARLAAKARWSKEGSDG